MYFLLFSYFVQNPVVLVHMSFQSIFKSILVHPDNWKAGQVLS